jgi:hypothetical protein
MLFVVLDDFLNNKIQEFLSEFGVKIGPISKVGEPRDLRFFAGWIGRGQGVRCFQNTHSLCVLEALAERVNKDRIKAVNAFAMTFQNVGGFGGCVGHKAPKSDV